ncbi:MAG: hypothetical protein H0U73_05190 [Tatlockia sp.]|nr:hypothetical protein [Tatlockia sp.]
MNDARNQLLCTDCNSVMLREQENQAVWWVCSKYPRCGVTAFEHRGKPRFSHDEPFMRPPREMPLYLESELYDD